MCFDGLDRSLVLKILDCISAVIAIFIYPKASATGVVFCSWLAASRIQMFVSIDLVIPKKRPAPFSKSLSFPGPRDIFQDRRVARNLGPVSIG